jgi:hypothetical protein
LHFASCCSQQSGLALLTKLYVGRSFHLWKVPELLPWLERNCKSVLELVDAGDARVVAAAEKRKMRYQGAPRNVYRHVIMSDIKDAATSLPRVKKAKAPKQSARAEMPVYPTITNGSGRRMSTNGQIGHADPLSVCVSLCFDLPSARLAQTRAKIKTTA